MNILIKDIDLIDGTDEEKILKKTNVCIKDKVIWKIGEVPEGFKADKIIDGSNKLGMPGLINGHTHIAMSLLRNYADDLPLWQWLTTKIWPIEAKLDGEDVYWGSMLSILEMIKGGTTCFSDMYFFMDETARAVQESGIKAVLCNALIGNNDENMVQLKKSEELFKRWKNIEDNRIKFIMGPHAPYTCSIEYLKEVIKMSEKLDTNIHIHLSESKKEVEDSLKAFGKSPIKLMEEIGLFNRKTIAAHCVHLSEEDIDILSQYDVSVVNNPGSNLKLGNGFAPVDKLLSKGVNVALGTDGASSNNNQDMFEEINLASIINKGVSGDCTSVPAYTAIKMATINGAKALGLDKECGTIEEGKRADIILIDLNKPHTCPRHNLISAATYSIQSSDVDTVIVDGKIIMENREVKTLDEEKIMYYAAKRAEGLIAK